MSGKTAKKTVMPTKAIRDAEFASRLEKALDGHPHVPPYNYGRLTWVRDQFKSRFKVSLSTETVRKWASGEARPRPSKMSLLARLLEVDEAWLSLGINPELDTRAREKRNVALSGAANVLLGFIQLDGASTAFPSEKDPRAGTVHFYAIIKGAQYAIHASLAQSKEVGVSRFAIPANYDDCTVIGVIKLAGTKCDFLEIPSEAVAERGTRKGGFYEVEVTKKGDEYVIGTTRLKRIKGFQERL